LFVLIFLLQVYYFIYLSKTAMKIKMHWINWEFDPTKTTTVKDFYDYNENNILMQYANTINETDVWFELIYWLEVQDEVEQLMKELYAERIEENNWF